MSLFKNDFEEGDFSAWTGTGADAGCSATIIATPTHHGSNAAKFLIDADSNMAYAYKETFNPATTLYARLYVRFEDLPTAGKYVGFLVFDDDDYASILLAALSNIGGKYYWRLYDYVTTGDYYSAEVFPSADTWYCVEVKLVMSDAAGEAKMWVDNVLVINQTGIDTKLASSAFINDIAIGYCGGQEAGSLFIDCVEVSGAQIGNEVFQRTLRGVGR